jgi:DNA-binding CsgD family transcriptional regulator
VAARPARATVGRVDARVANERPSGVLKEYPERPPAALPAIASGPAATATAAPMAGASRLPVVTRLIRNAIYADMPEAERTVAHEAAARLLLDEGAAPEQVAAHLLLSEPAGNPMVVGVLEQAAGRARVRGAHEAAVTYLRRALLEPPTSDRRAAVLRALGSAETGAGEALTVEHLREALALTGDPRERAEVSLDLALALNSQLRAPEAVEVLDAAASDVAESDPQFSLRLLAEQAGTGQLDRRTAALVADRIDGRFEALTGATPEERLMLASVAYLKAASVPIEGGELAERGFARGLLADQGSECVPVHQAIWALLVAERYELARRILDEALADAQSRGSEIGFTITGSLRCELAWRAGALADAIAEGQAALAVSRALGWTLPSALAYLILCLLERGELDSAVVELDSSHLDGDLPDHLLFNSLLCARGKLRGDRILLEEGIRDLLTLDGRERWQRNGESMLRFRSVSLPWRSYAALALGGGGRHADAVQLALEECRLAHDTELTRPYGIALRTLGLLHPGSVGIDYLRRSVKTLENSPARLEYARALTDLGSALRRDRQRAEARAPLRAGMKLARALDARPLAQRAHDELAASGEHVQRLNYLGRDQLTPSEMRIAKLAAEGRTNREIAQSLFLSQKTIEMHLRHAYQKLDISSRNHLPGALRDVKGADPGSPPTVR